jgi:hypothetical protein
MVAGIVLAVFFKDQGIQRKKYSWEMEETIENESDEKNEETNDGETPYWNTPDPDKNDLTVVYHFKHKKES